MPRFMQATVTFDNGTETTEIVQYGAHDTDKSFHAWMKFQNVNWRSCKTSTGGRYQALAAENLLDAIIEAATWSRSTNPPAPLSLNR